MTITLAKNREDYWAGRTRYHTNNAESSKTRRTWFAEHVLSFNPRSILEVGCNDGANLKFLRANDPKVRLVGVDINKLALTKAKRIVKNATFKHGSLYDLQNMFRGNQFDVVFTMGVLIHIPPDGLRDVCQAMLHIARQHVFHVERHDIESKPVGKYAKTDPYLWGQNFEAAYKGSLFNIDDVEFKSRGASHLISVHV